MTNAVSKHNTLLELRSGSLLFQDHTVWQNLDLTVAPGEFLAVLGPNGSGKTSLLQVLLGLQALNHGTITLHGKPPTRGHDRIGYIPQQKSFDDSLALRGRDLVELGVNGHRYGFARKQARSAVDAVLDKVGARSFADKPIGVLSGGEQQRLRVAQALVAEPELLLCDEPLLSLDIASQRVITRLIHDYRLQSGAAVVFVTHEVHPLLPYVDRILYIANGKWVADTPDNVLQSSTLSELYGTAVDVIKVRGHVHVIAGDDATRQTAGHHTGRAY